MLSKAIFQTINLVCTIGYNFGAFPYKWNPSTKEIRLTKSRLKLSQWYAVTIYMISNTIFMVVRIVQAACCMNIPHSLLFLNLFNVVTWTATSAFAINTILFRSEVEEFINQLMKTGQLFQNKFTSSLQWAENGSKKAVSTGSSVRKFTGFIYFYCSVQLLIATRTVDRNPKYFYPLIFNLKGVPKWKLLPIGAFECMMSYTLASLLLFYIIIYLAYVKSSKACINLLNLQHYTVVPSHYRILQVLNTQFNACFKTIVLPFLFLLLLGVNMIYSYATVRLFGEVKMPAYLSFPLISIAVSLIALDTFPSSYVVYDASQRLISATAAAGKLNGYLNKTIRSSRPLGVSVISFFTIKQKTIITFFEIVIENTIMLLLSF